jgi:acetyl-CoA acetyltransferase
VAVRAGRETAIAGIGQTEFSKRSGRSELQLAAEAVKAALDDAGIAPAEVDGLITFTLDPSDEIGLIRCLGIEDLGFTTRIPGGGAASVATIHQASAAVASGAAEVVVCWRAMNERSDGLDLIADIRTIYDNYGFETNILAASIRSANHMSECAKIGADVATAPPNVIKAMANHMLTDKGIESFMKDWAKTGQKIL